jgi:hypothetical protein
MTYIRTPQNPRRNANYPLVPRRPRAYLGSAYPTESPVERSPRLRRFVCVDCHECRVGVQGVLGGEVDAGAVEDGAAVAPAVGAVADYIVEERAGQGEADGGAETVAFVGCCGRGGVGLGGERGRGVVSSTDDRNLITDVLLSECQKTFLLDRVVLEA